MNNAETGSIITGTTRVQDLIPRFIELLWQLDSPHYVGLMTSPFQMPPTEAREDDTHEWWSTDEAAVTLEELMDALQDHAPPGYYFGAHPGDGADYGFWGDDDE